MKDKKYKILLNTIDSLIEGETDVITKMSTIACEIFLTFDYLNWVGFYRLVDENTLKVGPYQGTHGCLTIDINHGVCGKCAREQKVQIENDVSKLSHHIACSAETKSEIVIPVFDVDNNLKAVLDIDSVELNSFDEIDENYLTEISNKIFISD
jgi:GAF domain-containing protein